MKHTTYRVQTPASTNPGNQLAAKFGNYVRTERGPVTVLVMESTNGRAEGTMVNTLLITPFDAETFTVDVFVGGGRQGLLLLGGKGEVLEQEKILKQLQQLGAEHDWRILAQESRGHKRGSFYTNYSNTAN